MSFPGTMSAGFFVVTDSTVPSLPVITGTRFVYTFNGDTNGFFYHLGQLATRTWSNPHQSGQITVIPSSTGNNPGYFLVDRRSTGYLWYTDNIANSYIAFDIGIGRTFILSNILIQHDVQAGYYLRNFKIRGSNNVSANTVAGINAATWDDLAVFTNNTAINAPSSWGRFPSASPTAYRWFQLLQFGLNSSGTNHLALTEVELYGIDVTPRHTLDAITSTSHLTLSSHDNTVCFNSLYEILASHLLNSIAYSFHEIVLSHGAFAAEDSIHIDVRTHNAINDCDSTHAISILGHQAISIDTSSHQSAQITQYADSSTASSHKIVLHHVSINSSGNDHELKMLHTVSDDFLTQYLLLLAHNSIVSMTPEHNIIERLNWDAMTMEQWDKMTAEQWDKLG